jgi:NAD(P)-dependent dehydrogenase (short-subunit alcohol dehydrogenase family)
LSLFDLTGKVALIVGGGRGLGRASALALADAGATVAVASRTGSEVDSLVRDLGGGATAHLVDVRDVADIRRAVDDVLETHGRVDILVNSAGTNIQQSVLDVSEQAWDDVIATNLKGSFFCAQAVARHMLTRGSGKIINMASTFASLGFYGRAVYAASKGGMMQFTRVMALEWADRGVNVNAIGPTAVRTKMNAELFEDEVYRNKVLSRIPAGRWCEPEDVVGAVVFLASSASDMVNGHLLLVDGGWSAI